MTNAKIAFALISLAAIMLLSSQNALAAEEEPLPKLVFSAPDEEDLRQYLGLEVKAGESFSPEDIKADILLIELFSMYCPYCQKEAPLVNELFERMERLAVSGPVIKMIGIGASNSRFEVDHFRDTYELAFPVFPDKDMVMYRALEGAGTPGFIGVRLEDGKPPRIVLRNSGGFYSAQDFLEELVEQSGYETKGGS